MKKLSLFLLSAFMVSSVAFIGCGNEKTNSDLSVGTLLTDLQKDDISAAQKLIIKSNEIDEFNLYGKDSNLSELRKAYYKDVTFKVEKMDIKDEDNKGKGTIRFEYPDMKKICQEIFNNDFKDKELKSNEDIKSTLIKDITEKLKSSSYQNEDEEVNLSFKKDGDTWLIENNRELKEVLCDELNSTYVFINGAQYTIDGLNAIKTVNTEWLSNHGEKLDSTHYKNFDQIKPYLAKIGEKDKIIFNNCDLEDNKVKIDVTVKSPDIPKLVNDNHKEIEEEFRKEKASDNDPLLRFKLVDQTLEKKKFNYVSHKFNLETSYNVPYNTFNFSNGELSDDALLDYIFGDITSIQI